MTFEPIKKKKLADRVAERIREAIVGGEYQTGDALPSERELARQFGINRASVREALMRLEARGWVEIKQGGATRIRDAFRDAGLQLLPYLIAPRGEPDPELMKDLLAMRSMFLSWTAGEAAQLRSAEDLDRLEAIVDKMAASDDAGELQELDFEFFVVLVEMTNNQIMVLFANAMRQVYETNAEHFLFLYEPPFALAHHRAAVRAIGQSDTEAASAAMQSYARGLPAPE